LGLTHGRARGAVAFLGARLALRQSAGEWKEQPPEEKPAATAALQDSLSLLQTCLQEDPDHTEALWCLAAVRTVLGDQEGLAAQAPQMDRPGVADPRFHYLGAVCHLAAKEYGRAIELSRRAQEAAEKGARDGRPAPGEESLAVECHYLAGLA